MSTPSESSISCGKLQVAAALHGFVRDELLPGSGIEADAFWASLQSIIEDLQPRNNALLAERDDLQKQIDAWHLAHPGQPDANAYKAFLQSIGYLLDAPESVQITTANVDPEISTIAGPQLVVPLDNARYALNAANARWGSLYDALYGTDAIAQSGGSETGNKYNPIRGDKVVEYAREFLDRHFAIDQGSHSHATQYRVSNGQLQVSLGNGKTPALINPEYFVGYTGEPASPTSILLRKNGLHVELKINDSFSIGRRDHANVYDIHLESALSTIMDCEDSVAAVDVDDKLLVYRNWLGLMNGTLNETFDKGGKTIERKLHEDREFLDPQGQPFTLPGRVIMLVRNVGPHLDTDIVTLDGQPVTETFIDAMITAVAAKQNALGNSPFKNSTAGSTYIVKPKMHGPKEVALAGELFTRVENALDLEPNTLKMGIMDEERRTSVNLQACISEVSERVFFINTGFLDRTGDEIHTSMHAGPVLPKEEMKSTAWLAAYENSNVDTGIACGFRGKAQIGKGMWAVPDNMADMLETKIGHPKSGANTAWVPSPTVGTLHATHYHQLDVRARQETLATRERASVDPMLIPPLMDANRKLTDKERQRELENNAQGLLGYVSRWVGQGLGCSKVPDINNVFLMEDCATLRISSQHIANWLHHGIYTEAQVRETLEKMARIVDIQNEDDADYIPMSDDFEGNHGFQAALDLIFKGTEQPNGYTEHILQARRREAKAAKKS